MEKQNSDAAKEEVDPRGDLVSVLREVAQEARDSQQSIDSNLEQVDEEQEILRDDYWEKETLKNEAEAKADAVEQGPEVPDLSNLSAKVKDRFFRSQPVFRGVYESLEDQEKKLPKGMTEAHKLFRLLREEVRKEALRDPWIVFQEKWREYGKLFRRVQGDKEPYKILDNFLKLKTFYEDDMRPFLDEWSTDRLNTIIEGLVSAWSTNQSLREQIVRKLGPDGLSHMANMEPSDSREGQYRRNILALHLAGKKQDEIRKATGHRSQSKISTDLSKVKELMTAYFARDKAMPFGRDEVRIMGSGGSMVGLESIERPFCREDFSVIPEESWPGMPSDKDLAMRGLVLRWSDDDNRSPFGSWYSVKPIGQTGRIKAFLAKSTLSSLQIVGWKRDEDDLPKEALLSVHFIDYLWDKKTEHEANAMLSAISRIPNELDIIKFINPHLSQLPHICLIATSPVTNDWYSDSYLYIAPDLMQLKSALSHPTPDVIMGFGTKLSEIVPESTGERVLNWLYSD